MTALSRCHLATRRNIPSVTGTMQVFIGVYLRRDRSHDLALSKHHWVIGMKKNSLNPRTQDQPRGAAAVELAVCLPLILILTLATLQACSMFYLRQSLSVAAYEGIRKAVDFRTSSSEVEDACNRILTSRNVNGATILISPSDYTTAPRESWITVTVTAPCNTNSPLRGWFYEDKSLSGSATFMKEF